MVETSAVPPNADQGGDPAATHTQRMVGRIGRPHGLRGEVTVQVHTDFPEQRFAVGAQLHGDTGHPLTVETVRSHRGVLLVRFAGVTDREAAAELRGRTLSVDTAQLPDLTDPDEFYDHQLEGLVAVGPNGAALGTVREVVHAPASDLLVVDTTRGEVLVPFVQAIVPKVDLAAGRVVLDPPAGLLD